MDALSSRWQHLRTGTGGASAHTNPAAGRRPASWKTGQTRQEYASRHRGIQRAISARLAARHTVGRPVFGNVYHRPEYEAQQAEQNSLHGPTSRAPMYSTRYGDMHKRQLTGMSEIYAPDLWEDHGNEWMDEHGRRYVVTEVHLPAEHGQQERDVSWPQGPLSEGMQQRDPWQTGLQQQRQHSYAAPASHPMPHYKHGYPEAYPGHTPGSSPRREGSLVSNEEDDDGAAPVHRGLKSVYDMEHSWQQQVPLTTNVSTMQVLSSPSSYAQPGQVLRASRSAQRMEVQGARPSLSLGQHMQGAHRQHSGRATLGPDMQQAATHGGKGMDEFGVSLDPEVDAEAHEEAGAIGPVMEDAAVEEPCTWTKNQSAPGMTQASVNLTPATQRPRFTDLTTAWLNPHWFGQGKVKAWQMLEEQASTRAGPWWVPVYFTAHVAPTYAHFPPKKYILVRHAVC